MAMSLCSMAHFFTLKVPGLGVILDSDPCFKPHINKVTKSAFYHLANIVKVQPSCNQWDA